MSWNVIQELAALTLVVVFVIDKSGAKDTLLRVVSVALGREVSSLRPLTCSLCSTWWLGLLWLLIRGAFSIEGVAVVAMLALMTRPMNDLLGALTDALGAIVRMIDNLTNKVWK